MSIPNPETTDLHDVHDKLNEVKAMTAFMGAALMAIIANPDPQSIGDDEVFGVYLFTNHIEDEVSSAQKMLDEYEETLKTAEV